MAPVDSYQPTIGLEIHAELKTRTKMFCRSKNDPDETTPNTNVCPVCLAHPGTLPVINKEAVRQVFRVGAALGGSLADESEFDRKNYFYPDLPKGYQISQYKRPLVSGGALVGIPITRIHLEEDTARSQHRDAGESQLDFNRAGVPLMELVTEPLIRDAAHAARFARELQLLLRVLGASAAHMEKGEMRVEANVSVSRDAMLGTKVEVKNLNSFRSVERAIAYEIERQSSLLEQGGKVVQETRGWDEEAQETFSQRLKEESHDYRYFPDPDLPRLYFRAGHGFAFDEIRLSLPELPDARRERYRRFGLKTEDTEMFVADEIVGKFFDAVSAGHESDRTFLLLAANYLTSDLAGIAQESPGVFDSISPGHFGELIAMIRGGEVSSRGAKEVLKVMARQGGSPASIAAREGLAQESREEVLEDIVQKVLEAHAIVAAEYRSGKSTALEYLVGQCMKESRGSANPYILKKVLERLLSAS